MKAERLPIRRPLFDAPIYPGEDPRTTERGIPLPTNSIFATPEGKSATFGPDAYARYVLSPEKGKKPLLNTLATELVAHPSYATSLLTFTSAKNDTDTQTLTSELIRALPETIKKSAPLSERQARELISLATSDKNEEQLFATHILREYVNTTNRIDPTSDKVNLKAVEETQNRIVELLHTLTLAGLQMQDKSAYQFLFDVLSFKTPILTNEEPQAGLFAIAGQSPNDETLARAVLLDQTTGLFEQMFAQQKGQYAKQLVTAAKKSSHLTRPFIVQNTANTQREAALLDFFTNRYQKFGSYLEGDDIDMNDFYTKPLSFPESIIYVQSQKMWPLFLNLCSDVMLIQGRIKSPIVKFSLPDGSLRYIAEVDGHSQDLTRTVIAYALNETHYPSEVTEKEVAETFLTFTTPEIPEENIPEMKRILDEKKQALLHPVRGINRSGVEIHYGENHHIAATSLSVDRSGQQITLRMGNYSLHLQLNNTRELVDAEGKPLDLPEATRVWWETVVCAPLKELVCPSKEDGVLVVGTEGLPRDEALAKTKKVLLTRIGFLRRLPPGEGFTPEQAIKTSEVIYPLPGIERLDLAEYNKEMGYEKRDGQYTYVLPKEKEKADAMPLSIHTPHAFDDVQQFME